MQNETFTQLFKQLEQLTVDQSKKVQEYLHHKCTVESIEDTVGIVESCPYCHSNSFHKWGVRSELQRYRCKECHKTFNALTLTPLARLQHKEQWMKYAQDLTDGKSIRASAEDCDIHPSTSFRWRHRMLQIPSKTKADHFAGIVEFDDEVPLEGKPISLNPAKEKETLIVNQEKEEERQAREESRKSRQQYLSLEIEAARLRMPSWRKAIKIQLLK